VQKFTIHTVKAIQLILTFAKFKESVAGSSDTPWFFKRLFSETEFHMEHSSVNLHAQASCFLYLQGCMPLKWTAPEILSGKVAELSSQSDVYVQYVWVIDQVSVRSTWLAIGQVLFC